MPATNCPAGEWTLIASAPARFFARHRNPAAAPGCWLAFRSSAPGGGTAEPDAAWEQALLDGDSPTVRTDQLSTAALNVYARPKGAADVTLEWSVVL